MTRDELLSRISIAPDICFGKACVRGHRIWVSSVLDELADGRSVAEILQAHPGLTAADVRACMAYGAEMSRARGPQPGEAGNAASFWANPTIEELIKEQNVAPADDLDAISALWPEDDDPDELLDHILTQRREWRRMARGRTGNHE